MRLRRAALLSLLCLALVACGEPATRLPIPGAPGPTTRVVLGEMQLGEASASFKLHSDGTLESPGGARIGALNSAGELVNAHGTSVATLGADGNVDLGPDVDGITATIADDGTLRVTSKTGETAVASVAPDGSIAGTVPAAGRLRVTGADSPGKRRAIMLVLLAITVRRQPTAAPGAGSGAGAGSGSASGAGSGAGSASGAGAGSGAASGSAPGAGGAAPSASARP